MKINGEYYRTIWVKKGDDRVVQAIDQRRLPHRVVIEDLRSAADVAASIREMHVRGAGLIGAAAGYGMYLAALQAPRESEEAFMKVLAADGNSLIATRPTAVNLEWAVQRALREIGCADGIDAKIAAARRTA
ncbi:MAG: S-methyl-5-thioribose-1-phosphate isomerase, partial [Clostridia bacterium]|nr:S-methyl-5-thioribose-1-phosphate isomerase [Clostridia bacterium]